MRSHLYYYTHLTPPCEDPERAYGDDPGRWLPPPATASEHGWLVDLRADGVLPPQLATQRAEVLVGEPRRPGAALLRAISWHAVRADRIFPVLTGDLELYPLGGGGWQLTLTSTYRPPLSVVGGAADRLLGRRVAEACARSFVLAVAARLERADAPRVDAVREAHGPAAD